MATAESVFDGLGHLEEEIVIHFPTGQKDQGLASAVTSIEPTDYNFFPRRASDPFELEDTVMFYAMRRLAAQLFSHA